MQKNARKGFTLVELIVAITILSILGTIGFISLQGYSKNARDSSRISDIKNIELGIGAFQTKSGNYPFPDKYTEISASGTIIRYQGIVGDNVLRIIGLPTGKDPLTGESYLYIRDSNGSQYELAGFFEALAQSSPSILPSINQAYAGNNPTLIKTYGAELGIVWDNTINKPINEVFGGTGNIDIRNTTNTYKVIFNQNTSISGTGGEIFTKMYNSDSVLLNNRNLSSLDQSLVGHWDMETTILSGSLVVLKDFSKYGNNGVCNNGWNNLVSCGIPEQGPQFVKGDGKYGKAMNFDGIDDYIKYGVNGLPDGGKERTLYVKIKNSVNYMPPVCSIAFWGSNGNNNTFEIGIYGNDLLLGRWGGDIHLRPITTNTYDIISISCNGNTTCTINDNGRISKTELGYPLNTVLMDYGGIGGGRHFFYSGIIDEVRIYNRALSEQETNSLYLAGLNQ